MSNYYDYREVKVMIAHKLMAMEGWKVYGYKEDRSDSMTDYWDPANWDGVAEKNGYILCVDVYGAAEPQEIRQYNYDGFTYDKSIYDKIEKLKAMTVERGASEEEAASAKKSIERLRKKAEEATENREKYLVVGTIPGHMAHPARMNWHIEKDGIIIAKGNGILKYAHIWKYYSYSRDMEWLAEYKADKKAYADKHTQNMMRRGYYDNEEDARRSTERYLEELEEDIKLIDKFENFINKIDTTCGGLLGEGDGTIYERITVTEYKKENKIVEDTNGSIMEGQCFVLKSNFNYGRNKGYIYRIHESVYEDGQKRYHAYKLNGKKTKECTGQANQANYWYIYDTEKFLKWFTQGAIAWCHIEEVKTPYEVEKVVKKTIKAEKKNNSSATTEPAEATKAKETNVNAYSYEVSDDIDTRTGEKIYLVKVAEKLSREEYIAVNKYIKSLGGYWSRFKGAFLFKEDPADKLKINVSVIPKDDDENGAEDVPESEEKPISYTINESSHTKTGEKIWIVKPETQLDRADFAKVKQRFATLKGYYSSYVKGFIFKYDPNEALKTG